MLGNYSWWCPPPVQRNPWELGEFAVFERNFYDGLDSALAYRSPVLAYRRVEKEESTALDDSNEAPGIGDS